MRDWVLILQFGIPILLLVVGFAAGKINENLHYKSIHKREQGFLETPAVTWRTLDNPRPIRSATMAAGSVVVSVDHFKRLMMAFRRIFGGEILSYSSLLDRGRREAILRMKESVPGADIYLNCRVETATIFSGQGRATGSVEVLAYGTAVIFES